jgi:signal peptidase II
MLFYITVLLSLFADVVSKYLANSFLVDKKIHLIWDFFVLQLFKNSWIAFSVPVNWIILKITTIILIVWIIIYFLKYETHNYKKIIKICYGLIVWWALWNCYERIYFWHVTDFLYLKYFAIFNFADIFIDVWVILIILTYTIWKHKKKK